MKCYKGFNKDLQCTPNRYPFPSVRECYRTGDRFFFPALNDFENVTYWQEMPEFPKEV